MFYYYGRKKKLANRYPAPRYATIIEPFAGSAAYSCAYAQSTSRVMLFERDARIVDLWKRLQSMSEAEILEMADLEVGTYTDDLLHIVHAATKMAFAYKEYKVTHLLARNWTINKRMMANQVSLVRDWEITCGDYTAAPDIEATWFIDPPYMGDAGQGYAWGSDALNYERLARWAVSRRGQVIVCAGEDDDYLPFVPLIDNTGIGGKRNVERVWIRDVRAEPPPTPDVPIQR